MNHPKAKPARGPRTTYVDLPALDAFKGEALGLFVWSDVRPLGGVAGYVDWRLCGALSQTLVKFMFKGDADETLLLPSTGRLNPRRIFVFGMGPAKAWDTSVLRNACRRAHDVMVKAGVKQVCMAAPAWRSEKNMEMNFYKAVQEELGGSVEQVLVERI